MCSSDSHIILYPSFNARVHCAQTNSLDVSHAALTLQNLAAVGAFHRGGPRTLKTRVDIVVQMQLSLFIPTVLWERVPCRYEARCILVHPCGASNGAQRRCVLASPWAPHLAEFDSTLHYMRRDAEPTSVFHPLTSSARICSLSASSPPPTYAATHTLESMTLPIDGGSAVRFHILGGSVHLLEFLL